MPSGVLEIGEHGFGVLILEKGRKVGAVVFSPRGREAGTGGWGRWGWKALVPYCIIQYSAVQCMHKCTSLKNGCLGLVFCQLGNNGQWISKKKQVEDEGSGASSYIPLLTAAAKAQLCGIVGALGDLCCI